MAEQMQQMMQNVYGEQAFEEQAYGGQGQASGAKRLPTEGYDPKKMVIACIITVFDGSSYDDLFRREKPAPPEDAEDGCISLFQLGYGDLEQLMTKMSGVEDSSSRESTILDEVVADIGKCLDPHSVVFNFECCSGCSDKGVPAAVAPIFFKFLRFQLDRSHVLQFGDFSVKALIGTWDEPLLGPNPFLKVCECSGSIELNFELETLKTCPSTQLVAVGSLCETAKHGMGSASLHVMGGTVVFGVDQAKADTSAYRLQVLTVATKVAGLPQHSKGMCKIGDVSGPVGHALLTFPSKKEGAQPGLMILSAGHWIELSRLNVSQESVLNAGNMYNNATEQVQMRSEFTSAGTAQEKSAVAQKWSKRMVSKQTPGAYQKKF